MKLIVDTNKILACIIKDGKVRRILFLPDIEFYSPKYAIEEIINKRTNISKKVPVESFEFLLTKVKEKVKFEIVIDREIINHAKELARNFDYYDFPFIALALKFKIPIWTNDKDMIRYSLKSGEFVAIDTEALEGLIKGDSINTILENLREKHKPKNGDT